MKSIILTACPKCGCFDIRKDFVGNTYCFKCGYTEPKEQVEVTITQPYYSYPVEDNK